MNNTKSLHKVNYRRMEYEELQDVIRRETGIKDFSVLVRPEHVSIRTSSYVDFVLAMSAIKGRVSKPIIRDVLGEKEPHKAGNQPMTEGA